MTVHSSGRCSALQAQLGLVLLLLMLHSISSVADTRICLNMIAKNEAQDILQCLQPLVPELAGWTLCDTGSTDGTVEIVENFFAIHSIPGITAVHSWQDFGHNRNLCIEEGLKFSMQEAKRQGLPKSSHYCDYLIFLDADQIMHRPADMQPGILRAMDLKGDGYYMTEQGVGVTYQNLRLVSTRLEWEWVGEVHEYVHRKDGQSFAQQTIEGVWFHHDAAGGQDGKRFVRDEQILRKAVHQRPADTRARFYYANTLRALGHDEEAIKNYIERIRLGGWDEERFNSALSIADIAKSQWEKGELISSQVVATAGSWDSSEAQLQEEGGIQAALAALEAAKSAAQASIHVITRQHAALDSGTNKALAMQSKKKDKTKTIATRQSGQAATNQQGFDNASGTDAAAEVNNKTVDAFPRVQEAARALQAKLDERRTRQFSVLVSAYLAAAAILPYRAEPWVQLARLYRTVEDDTAKCFSYASAGVAQGPPRKNALFLNTNAAKYEALDEMCICAYYVDQMAEEGRTACRKLKHKLQTDLLVHTDNAYLSDMLSRTKSNLEWYAKKAPGNALPEECPADAQHLCGLQKAPSSTVSTGTVSEV